MATNFPNQTPQRQVVPNRYYLYSTRDGFRLMGNNAEGNSAEHLFSSCAKAAEFVRKAIAQSISTLKPVSYLNRSRNRWEAVLEVQFGEMTVRITGQALDDIRANLERRVVRERAAIETSVESVSGALSEEMAAEGLPA